MKNLNKILSSLVFLYCIIINGSLTSKTNTESSSVLVKGKTIQGIDLDPYFALSLTSLEKDQLHPFNALSKSDITAINNALTATGDKVLVDVTYNLDIKQPTYTYKVTRGTEQITSLTQPVGAFWHPDGSGASVQSGMVLVMQKVSFKTESSTVFATLSRATSTSPASLSFSIEKTTSGFILQSLPDSSSGNTPGTTSSITTTKQVAPGENLNYLELVFVVGSKTATLPLNEYLTDITKIFTQEKGVVVNFALDSSGVDYSVSIKLNKSDGANIVSIPSKKLSSSQTNSVVIPTTTKLTNIYVEYQTSNMKVPLSIPLTITTSGKLTSGSYSFAYNKQTAMSGSVPLPSILKALSSTQKSSVVDIAQQVRLYMLGDNKEITEATWNSIIEPALSSAGLSSMDSSVKKSLEITDVSKPATGGGRNIYG